MEVALLRNAIYSVNGIMYVLSVAGCGEYTSKKRPTTILILDIVMGLQVLSLN